MRHRKYNRSAKYGGSPTTYPETCLHSLNGILWHSRSTSPGPKGLGFCVSIDPFPIIGDEMLDAFLAVMHDVTVELIVLAILYVLVGPDRR